MTVIQIPDEHAAALRAKAAAQGLTLEEWIERLAFEETTPTESVPERSRRHISEIIRERMKNVPPKTLAAMPKDGASQHDHYIYGLPKKEE